MHTKANRKSKPTVRPLTSDEESSRELYRQRDRDKVTSMKATRYADQQAWEIRYQEALHEWHIRNFRLMWDGTITIGEN